MVLQKSMNTVWPKLIVEILYVFVWCGQGKHFIDVNIHNVTIYTTFIVLLIII